MPLHIVDGRIVEPHKPGALARLARFLVAPFATAWHHRDLIAAILRREVAERFKGSVAGWVWAVVAPLLAIAVYTLAFSGKLDLPAEYVVTANRSLSYALFILSGIVVFNFLSEMAFRAPMLLHEYT